MDEVKAARIAVILQLGDALSGMVEEISKSPDVDVKILYHGEAKLQEGIRSLIKAVTSDKG